MMFVKYIPCTIYIRSVKCTFLQAMNSTNMWVLTNGLDGGITKIVGDAVRFERERRFILTSRKKDLYVKLSKRDEVEDLPKLTVMGVVPKLQIDFDANKEGIVRHFKRVDIDFNTNV